MKRVWIVLGALIATATAEMRVFRNAQGVEIEAEFLSFQGDDKVEIRRTDGKTFTLKWDQLSAEDQEFLSKLKAEGTPPTEGASELDEAAGHELFAGGNLLEREAAEIAKKLGLRSESTAEGLLSWRLYAAFGRAPGKYRLFGTLPYSVALYADEEGKFSSLSAVYSNKGDYGSTSGFALDHFKESGKADPDSLQDAMDADLEIVTERLEKVLGEGQKIRYGDTGSRLKALSWEVGEVSILLTEKEGEFVGLNIVSKELVEASGRTAKVADDLLKQRLATAINKSDNGDRWISGIPMVNQGPKGYCVPATFERVMRFMGVETDMYLLAMVGQTQIGGGTSMGLLFDEVKSHVRRKGRSVREEFEEDLKLSKVKRYLDEGTPVIWRMCSLDTYNKIATENSKKRQKVEDWDAWTAEISETNIKYEGRERVADKFHCCMIVGYNEKTQELAVSDSWGARYELRWVPLQVANWAHNGTMMVIKP